MWPFSRKDFLDGLCSKCTKLVTLAKAERFFSRQISLGSADDVRKRAQNTACACCKIILKILNQDPTLPCTSDDLKRLKVHIPTYFSDEGLPLSAGTTHLGYVHIGCQGCQCPLFRSGQAAVNHRQLKSRANADRLDLQQIRGWINECESLHGGHCFPGPSETQNTPPDDSYNFMLTSTAPHPSQHSVETSWTDTKQHQELWLVDVIKKERVRCKSPKRYITLSYRCGTQENGESTVLAEGPLSESEIPLVVRDSMKFVEDLGEKYLWVDSLCIARNGPDFDEELARMDMIYSQSVLTIVAMSGASAADPLPGVSQQRCAPTCREYASDLEFISRPPSLVSCIARSEYKTRGWTFQEELLSKRRIYFTHQQVFFDCTKFQCREIGFKEDYIHRFQPFPNPIVELRRFMRTVEPGRPFPFEQFMTVYEDLVISYSKRKLTEVSDTIRAFTGILSALEKLIPDTKFVSGLPLTGIDMALLWRGTRPIESRFIGEGHLDTQRELFPSWSWASWTGPVSFMMRYQNMTHSFSNIRENSFSREWAILGIESKKPGLNFNNDEQQVPENTPTYQPISPKLEYDVLHVWADTVSAKAFWAQGGKILSPTVPDEDENALLQAKENVSRRMEMMNHLAGQDMVNELGSLVQDIGMPHLGYQVLPKNAKGLGCDPSSLEMVLMSRVRQIIPSTVSRSDLVRLALNEQRSSGSDSSVAGASNWDLLNVMLVYPKGSTQYVCRATVGQVDQCDWSKMRSQKKYLRLA